MNKRLFIQQCTPIMLLAQLLHRETGDGRADPARAIAWAEALWDRLTVAGYGEQAVTAGSTRPVQDHVGALEPRLADSFARLWKAYNYPKGKQEAARAWATLAPDDGLTAIILAAAEAEAKELRPEGAVRKYLQGWLTARRWEDRPIPGAAAQDSPEAEAIRLRADLLGERRTLMRLALQPGADPALAAQIETIDERLRELGISLAPVTPSPARRGRPQSLREITARLGPRLTGGEDQT